MTPDESAPALQITAFEWVPVFARGFVRDLRPRWACEEAGLPYRERLISATQRPEWYFAEQPWGQVPTLHDDGVRLFESGAILLHLGESAPVLLPPSGQPRADVISWLFAALNSLEPAVMEFGNVTSFAKDEEWARLRRPSLEAFLAARLAPIAHHLASREWLGNAFSIADIAMITILRELEESGLMAEHPTLTAYIARGTGRPAFQRALSDQLAAIDSHRPTNFDPTQGESQ